MNTMKPDWNDILKPLPVVCLILGGRGEGKTALGHRLLEEFGWKTPRDAYIMGFPDEKADLLPPWVEILPVDTTFEEWPEDSVVLVHEAHHIIHARRAMDAENLEIDFLLTVSRHRNSCVVFETQQSRRLDINSVAAVDGIVVRYPALMQEEFERPQVRDLIGEAKDVLDQYVEIEETEDYTFREKSDEVKKHAYVYAERFRGEYPYEIALPEHWSEEISKAYSEPSEVEAAAAAGGGGLEADELDALEKAAQWEADHRPYEYDVSGFDYDDLGVHYQVLSTLSREGLIEKQYSSSNKPNRYRLTEEGWQLVEIEEPPGPVQTDS